MTPLILLTSMLMFQTNGDVVVNERFRVEYVRLDVLARDKKGNPVFDLKPEDFDVRENGKKVKLSFFEVLDLRVPEPGEPLPEETITGIPIIREKQQIIIAIDLESAQLIESRKTFKQLHKFLEDLDPELDTYINIYSMDRGSITDGFSNKTEQIKAALTDLEERHFDGLRRNRESGGGDLLLRDHDPGYRGRQPTGLSNLRTDDPNNFIELERAFRSCQDLYGSFDSAGLMRCLSDTLEAFIEEQRIRTERVLGELELLAYKFENEKGLKTIMLVSPGFALHSVSSAYELAQTFQGRGDRGAATFPGTYGKLFLEPEFQRVVHACIKNRIIFHTFDIYNGNMESRRALGVEFQGASRSISGAYRSFESDITMGLRELSDQSGGTFIQSPTLGPAMTKTMQKNNYFYVIGYESPEGKRGKFRKIKIKSKRKGVKFRYRKGYFGN